jgi:glycerol-3-phosphate dehydrogenase
MENLPGGREINNFSDFVAAQTSRLSKYGFDEKQISYLLGLYGSRICELLGLVDNDPSLNERICSKSPDILAQVVLAVKSEFALTVSDFMMRRVPIAFNDCQGLDCVDQVASKMGQLLGWGKEKTESEVIIYKQEIDSRFVPKATNLPSGAID